MGSINCLEIPYIFMLLILLQSLILPGVASANKKQALRLLFCLLVTPAGVEPAIFWMRTRRPGPLDEGARYKVWTQGGLGPHFYYIIALFKIQHHRNLALPIQLPVPVLT